MFSWEIKKLIDKPRKVQSDICFYPYIIERAMGAAGGNFAYFETLLQKTKRGDTDER